MQQQYCQMKRFGKVPLELTMGKNSRWYIYSIMFELLPLSLNDCQRKRDFDLKPSSAEFENNGRI